MARFAVMAEPIPDLSSAALRQVVGRRIRQLRRQKNLTQYQLAKRAKIAPNTLRGIETGGKHTQFAKLIRVARALSTTVGVLMHTIQGEPDAWANPLLRDLRTEDLQMAQQYHHASSPVRTAVRRLLANPDVLRGVRQQLVQGSYA